MNEGFNQAVLKVFANIYKNDPDRLTEVNLGKQPEGRTYNLSGAVVKNPKNGIYIIDGKKVLKK